MEPDQDLSCVMCLKQKEELPMALEIAAVKVLFCVVHTRLFFW